MALLVALFAANVSYAATYYVAANSGDSNTGLSPSAAWKTLDKVNGVTFLPGDRILLRAGDRWNGQLAPLGSGADGQPIVIDQYGKGGKPAIHGPGTNNSAAVLLENQSWWEINNLEVTNTQKEDGAIT